jgi:S-adenosylmethionine:tRNA ribosyltransferase-isomerase
MTKNFRKFMLNIHPVDLNEYNYDLPHDRIAQYPVAERDQSMLLVSDRDGIRSDIFRNIGLFIPDKSLLVFNNTRVIRARILFRKETGAVIEVLCLEPLNPAGYDTSLGSVNPVEWKCMIGNLKKWKGGKIVNSYRFNGKTHKLTAERIRAEGDAWCIRFEWDDLKLSFGDMIELAGRLPLPPYVDREAEESDLERYQTVYSRIKGSVAAPTAGLHFTEEVLGELHASGIKTTEVTLHVGAGTFKPIKSQTLEEHEMHYEHFSLTIETAELLKENAGSIIAVGTTSVRTLESLYWIGAGLTENKNTGICEPVLGQWDPYKSDNMMPACEALEAIIGFMKKNHLATLNATTGLMIIPGYRFRMIEGMITNFHQPMSTLLLLVSAWTGNRWKEIYQFALDHDFRFLSYGDASILLRND